MNTYIAKTNGSWDTLRKISDITEIQIIDPIEFEVAVVFNELNIEFKDWILEEIKLIDGVESVIPKNEIEKYSKIYHIQHYSDKLETLCGINGRLGLKVDFYEATQNNKKLCRDCVERLHKINYTEAIDYRTDQILVDESEE